MKKVIVFHHGALGDLFLSLPAIRAVRAGDDVSVHLVCRPDLHEILLANGVAERVSSKDEGRLAVLYSGSQKADWLKGYDTAYVFGRSPGILHETLRSHVPQTVFVRTVPPEESGLHCGVYQFLQVAGDRTPETEARYELGVDAAPIEREGRATVCIHPGSGGGLKCWPAEKFLKLIGRLAVRGDYTFRILLGPAEDIGYDRRIAEGLSRLEGRVDVVKGLRLVEAASFVASSSWYIGNDSGISHLAAALGVPGVAVFGPTDPRLWRPWGDGISVAASERECAPCGGRYRECGDPVCLRDMEVDHVLGVFEGLRISAGCSS